MRARCWLLRWQIRALVQLLAFSVAVTFLLRSRWTEHQSPDGLGTESATTPSVSIILPVYNSLKYIRKALDSLDAQFLKDFEVIVVDDGSTDGTDKVVSNWAADRPYCRLVQLPRNSGLPAALNAGHRASRGALLTWVSADNVQYANFTQVLYNALLLYPECDVTFADHNKIGENGGLIAEHALRKPPRLTTIVKGNPGLAAFMYRRSCFSTAGEYREDLQGVEDWEEWGRMLKSCRRAVYIPTPLMGYRLHGGSLTGKLGRAREQLENEARGIIWGHAGRIAGLVDASMQTALAWYEAGGDAQMHELTDAAQAFADAHMRHPSPSLLDVLRDTLAACAGARPVTLRAVTCAANLIAVTATYGGGVDAAAVEETRTYALFVYEQLGDGEDVSDGVRKLLKTAPPSGTPLRNTWVSLMPPSSWRRLRRLLDAAYTISDARHMVRPALTIVTSNAFDVPADVLPMFDHVRVLVPLGKEVPIAGVPSDVVAAIELERVLEHLARIQEHSVLHAVGAWAAVSACQADVPDHVALLLEFGPGDTFAFANMQCATSAHFLAHDTDIARGLVQAGVPEESIFVRGIADVLIYRLVLARSVPGESAN